MREWYWPQGDGVRAERSDALGGPVSAQREWGGHLKLLAVSVAITLILRSRVSVRWREER